MWGEGGGQGQFDPVRSFSLGIDLDARLMEP